MFTATEPLPAGFRSIELHANGLRFAAFEGGSGDLALLLHGFPDDARSMLPLAERFVAAGFRSIAPYLRGYGPSDPAPDGDYGTVSLARDAVGLIDAAGAETATIVGHDWGAVAAYVAASLAPARVRRIVTMSVPPPRIFIPSFSATPRRSGGAGTWGTSSCRAPRPASPPTISHSSIGSGAIGAPAGISRPSASPASRPRSATRKARAKRSATIDRSCVPSSSPARARSRLIASRSRASPCPPSSSRAIATDASRARCTPGSRARSRARSVSRSSAAPVTSYRSRRRIASPISRSRSPAPGRAHRPRKRASRRSTKDWRPSLKSSVAKTAFSIDGIAATATRSASAR